MSREILVYADWETIADAPKFVGTLRATESRGQEVFAFSYDERWLAEKARVTLDPDLQFFGGDQYLADGRPSFGLFLDSSPDRWGRVLMRRREAAAAAGEGRPRRSLLESDYLLGVHDGQRLGGLRFRTEPGGPFMDNRFERTAPPSTSLRELQQASWQVQNPDADSAEIAEWLSLLIAPGSSLGGARPKAGVQYPDGDLWIAKFPGWNDSRDMGAWERMVWELGKSAGLNQPDSECLDLGGQHRTFLVRRFDRVAGSKAKLRRHFASAMTLLGHADGDDHQTGASYLELCDWISNNGAQPAQDLPELWRRIVFSMFISNTDDHLRNHGFLLTPKGWTLSPAYDVNAEPTGPRTGLSLNVNEDDNRLDPDLAMEVAPFFRVEDADAKATVAKIRAVVGEWRSIAQRLKLGRAEIEAMEPAFALSHD